jgi:hypothetical protein
LKHRFFEGPIRELLPAKRELTYTEERSVDEETYHDNYALPPRVSIPNGRAASGSKFDYRSNGHEGSSVDRQGPSRRGSGKDPVGLRTVLEEIGVSEDYRRRRSSREITSKDHLPSPIWRDCPYDGRDDNRFPSLNSGRGVYPQRQTSLDVGGKESHRVSRQSEGSNDSYSQKKEAGFDYYKSDYKHKRRTNDGPYTKSPGEGLRSALGNLESYLNIPSVKNRHSSNAYVSDFQSSQRPFDASRFKNSRKEPHNHRPRGQNQHISSSSAPDYLPTFEPEPEERSNVRQGLLSLLSDLHQTHNCNSRDRIPLTSAQPRNHELLSYTPLLPRPVKIPAGSSFKDNTHFAAKYAFSTIGIPLLTQRTKHGLVEIKQSGDIELHLPHISRNTFTISADSKHISVNGASGTIWRGDVDDLPWRWTKIYRYASRFVTICRARLPLLTLEMDEVKGRLMLNGEFEAYNAKDGIVSRILPEERSIKIFIIDKGGEKLQWQGAIEDIPRMWRDVSRSTTALYNKCLALSKGAIDDGHSDGTARCVPGVGWCSVHGKTIQLLFEDAVRIEIQLQTREILYCDGSRKKERWRLADEELPEYIRERLARSQVFKV